MRAVAVAILVLAAAVLVAPLASADPIPPPGIWPKCATVLDQPDAGLQVCVDLPDHSCEVYLLRSTFTGTTKTCIDVPNDW